MLNVRPCYSLFLQKHANFLKLFLINPSTQQCSLTLCSKQDIQYRKEALLCCWVPTCLRFALDILVVLKHVAEIKLLLVMLETHLRPSDYTLSFNIKTSVPSAQSLLMLFSSGRRVSTAAQIIISCPLHPVWHTSVLHAWLTFLAAVFFSFFFLSFSMYVQSLPYAATYLTSSNTHSNTPGLSLLGAAYLETWLFRVTCVTFSWTNKIIPDHNLWGETHKYDSLLHSNLLNGLQCIQNAA